MLDIRNGAWIGGLVRAHEKLAELVNSDTRIVPAHGALLTGSDIVRHRDMYQQLFLDLNVFMNDGMGPEDMVELNPVRQFEAELGDPTAFLNGAYRSMLIANVPD